MPLHSPEFEKARPRALRDTDAFVEELPDRTVVTLPRRGALHKTAVSALAFLGLALLVWLEMEAPFRLALLFAVPALPCALWFVHALTRRAEFTLRPETLELRHGGTLWRSTRRWPRREIRALERQPENVQINGRELYRLELHRMDGRILRLFAAVDQEAIQQMAVYLNAALKR